jgi:hypothetical protein
MKKEMLVFSNQAKMVAFILAWKKYNMEVNFSEKTLYGAITETEMDIACAEYGASVKREPDKTEDK